MTIARFYVDLAKVGANFVMFAILRAINWHQRAERRNYNTLSICMFVHHIPHTRYTHSIRYYPIRSPCYLAMLMSPFN